MGYNRMKDIDALIAEKIKLTREIGPSEAELKRIIKDEITNTYNEYIDHVTANLNTSKQLLVKEKLKSYFQAL